MREYTEFDEFYNNCISIIKNNIQRSNIQKIKFIRENVDKNILNSYYNVGSMPKDIANVIECKTTIIKLSMDNMIKNLLEHPEITIEEYKNISL
jgi:hypothetical protein